jgi:biopolymer transport protein ExbD
MTFYTRRRRAPSIQIVSMVDILAILLIFFIVTTTFRKQTPQLLIELPKSTTASEAPAAVEPVLVSVESAERIDVGGRIVNLAGLRPALETLHAEGRPLGLQVDRRVPFETVVKVLDAFREAGIPDLPTFLEKPE